MVDNSTDCVLDLSILAKDHLCPTTLPDLPHPNLEELPWYRWWVLKQLRDQPRRVLLALTMAQPGEPGRPGQPGEDVGRAAVAQFFVVWHKIREVVLAPGPKTIDKVAQVLVELGLLHEVAGNEYEASRSARELVFAILGWQTMLYKPDFCASTWPSFPSSSTAAADTTTRGYNIVDEMGGHRGAVHLCLGQSAELGGRKNLPEFLLGFGLMLPPRNYCALENEDDRVLFDRTRTVVPRDIDAHVLAKVCRIKFRWVDSLACHLELDRSSNTLFVYRYPSFCVARLRQHASSLGREEGGEKDSTGSVLHRCSLEKPSGLLSMPWATEKDVSELLCEILLSYRLLFGTNRRSRTIFRGLQPFASVPREGQDQLLTSLCGRKHFDCSPATLIERDEYDLASDFPHLRSRLVRLSGYAASRKPRSLRELWQDKRDSPAWLAIWSVLIFGTLSLLLAVLQTVFQILQYWEGTRGSG